MRPAPRRSAFTLIELLIVIAVVAVLLALTLPAIQKMRAAASRSACSNNLRQIGLALYGYHSTHGVLPQAYSNRGATEQARRSWATLVLPFLEQENLQNKDRAFQETQAVPVFLCPAGVRGGNPGGYTHYLAVEGTDYQSTDGVLYHDSKTQLGDIRDGLATTVMVGERPPSPDLFWGHWVDGPFHSSLGARSTVVVNTYSTGAQPGPGAVRCLDRLPGVYAPGRPDDYCDTHHFWSFHPGGGQWLFADGSARFLGYAAAPLIPQLATRAGGERVDLSDF